MKHLYLSLGVAIALTSGCLPAAPSYESDVDAEGGEVDITLTLPDSQSPPDSYSPPDTWWERTDCWFGEDTYRPPVAGVEVELVGLTPPPEARQIVWKVTARNDNGRVADLRYVSATGGGTEKALSTTIELDCFRTVEEREHTLEVETVGVYQDPVQVSGISGPWTDPSPDFVPTISRTRFTCGQSAPVRVVTAPAFEVGYADAGPHGIYDRGFVFAGLACHAELDCCQDDDRDGECDRDRAWYPPEDGVDGATLEWRFFCFALGAQQDPQALWQPTDLFLSDLRLDCGDGGEVAIDPTARVGESYCDHPGDGETPPSGCVGVTGVESGLIEQVAVDVLDSASPYIESRLSVRLAVDKAALAQASPFCSLHARATGVRGVTALGQTGLSAPNTDGAWELGPGVAYPTLRLDAVLTANGELVCGSHSQMGYPQITLYADGEEPPFDHRIRQPVD